MLLTIVRLCGFEVKKKLVAALLIVGALMFAVIATSGILPWYYKEVELTFVDGAAKLEKAISEIPGVKKASVSFIAGKMIVEAEDSDFDSIVAKIPSVAKKTIPDCTVII